MATRNTAEQINALLAKDDATIAQALREVDAKGADNMNHADHWRRVCMIEEIERRHPQHAAEVIKAVQNRPAGEPGRPYVDILLEAVGC